MSGGCCEVCGGRCAVTYHLAGLDPHQRLREECVVLRRGWEGGRVGREGEGGEESECESRRGRGRVGEWREGGKGDRKQRSRGRGRGREEG